MENSKTILLVDDDPSMRRSLTTIFKHAGMIVVPAIHVDSALRQMMEGLIPHGIICDYHMPGTTGLEFFRTLRRLEFDMPFVLISGRWLPEIGHLVAEKPPGFLFMQKPFVADEIIAFFKAAFRAT